MLKLLPLSLAACFGGSPDTTTCFPPAEGQAGGEAVVISQPIGSLTLVTEQCPKASGPNTIISARIEGKEADVALWSFDTKFSYDAFDAQNEIYQYEIYPVGALGDVQFLALHKHECDLDSCDKVTFIQAEPGEAKVIAADTQAESYQVSDRVFSYHEKTGYEEGYHVASAEYEYRWSGKDFERSDEPKVKAEITTWPCPDTAVIPIDREGGVAIGDPIPVPTGTKIKALYTDPGASDHRFLYEVNGKTFWTADWKQDCAG